jgi:hypothetical protein
MRIYSARSMERVCGNRMARVRRLAREAVRVRESERESEIVREK